MQALNAVSYPELSCTLPILACELLILANRVHILVLDGFNLHDDTLHPDLAACFTKLRSDLPPPLLDGVPEWGAHVFSRHAIIVRPGSHHDFPLDTALSLLERLWKVYAQEAPSVVEENPDSTARLATYLAHHAKHEPTRDVLSRITGSDYAHALVDEVLFPQWLTHRTPVMAALKRHTTDAHRALEGLPFHRALLSNALPLHALIRLLTTYLSIHRALEDVLSEMPHPLAVCLRSERPARSPLLVQDLQSLDITPEASASEPLAKQIRQWKSQTAKVLGVLYVFEGSALGAPIVYKHLAETFSLKPGEGLRYYTEPGLPWKRFGELMNTHLKTPFDHSEAIEGALASFGALSEVFDRTG